jgi:hypothetical protein
MHDNIPDPQKMRGFDGADGGAEEVVIFFARAVVVACGRMSLNEGNARFLCGDGVTYLTSDSAISVAYAHGGKRVQLLINYNLYEVEITFDRPYNVYTDADLQNAQRVERCTMQPLSVILLELE